MRFSPQLLDEIRSRLPVSRVVERRVKLKRAGREYTGLSPFKTERTPSFTVNDQKGFYHCFASGEHGDIFTFVMKTEGLSFPEAIERLAGEAGVVLPEDTPQPKAIVEHETRLREASETACQYFQAALFQDCGSEARAYLARRGVGQAEIKGFRLGFAPDSRAGLKNHLAAKGFTPSEIQDAGLVIHGDDIPVSYDRFRGRLMFPIADAKGRVIAFGGRALTAGQQPKYLNSPDTPLFHKGHTLFNLSAAKAPARGSQTIIVAEGYMDVIALTQAGFTNAVAPLGTALTEDQLRLLWALSPSPTLCFDGDAAGQKAAFRAIDIAMPHLEPGRSLHYVFLPEGQDPDDVLRKSGADALAAILTKPIPLFDVLWKREERKHPLETPEQRASFEVRIMELAGRIAHKTLRFNYISKIRERLKMRGRLKSQASGFAALPADWRARSSLMNGGGNRAAAGGNLRSLAAKQSNASCFTQSLLNSPLTKTSASEGAAREALIIKALMSHPWLLDDYVEDVAGLFFENVDCQTLQNELLSMKHGEMPLDSARILHNLEQIGAVHAVEAVNALVTHRSDSNLEAGADKIQVVEAWHHVIALHKQAMATIRDLKEAEEDHFRDQSGENFARVNAIRQQVQIPVP